MKEILNIADLAEILGRSERAIRIALHRGQEGITIPFSTKLGSRRVFLRSSLERFLSKLEKQTFENDDDNK